MENSLQENPDCLRNFEQHFLVSVSVYKARHLNILNADTFVMVSLNGKYKRTKTSYRTENPYFNEYFIFELYCTETDLLRKNIHFVLYRSSVVNTAIGEFTLDLRTVWQQKHHAILKKWGTFEWNGREALNDLHRGYLMIDIAISCSYETPSPVVFDALDCDEIENNRIVPYDAKNERERVRYCCNIFQGDFVNSDEYIVRVHFGGLQSRTKPSAYGRSHRWNEKLSFIGTFPSLSQTFVVQLLTASCCYKKVKSTKEFQFSFISKQTEGVYHLPTYGPSIVYFYTGAHDSRYLGKILLSINTEVLSAQAIPARKVQMSRIEVSPLLSNYWKEETFVVSLYIFNFQRFAQSYARRIMLYLTCVDIRSKALTITMDKLKTFDATFGKWAEQTYLQITVKVEAPDSRHKYYITSVAHGLLHKLRELNKLLNILNGATEHATADVREHLSTFTSEFEAAFEHACEVISNSSRSKNTRWDEMRKTHALEQLAQLKVTVVALAAKVRLGFDAGDIERMLKELHRISATIANIGVDEQNCYPDILLHLSRPEQASVDAVCRFNMADYFLPLDPSTPAGSRAGQRCSILARSISCNHSCPDRCGCVYCKLDYVMVIDTVRSEQDAPQVGTVVAENPSRSIPVDPQEGNQMQSCMVNCKVYVHQGRIYCGFNETELCNAKLTVLFETHEASLSTVPQTLSPCWSETVELTHVPFIVPTNQLANQREHRSTIMCLLQDDRKKSTLMGIGWLDTMLLDDVAQSQLIEINSPTARFIPHLRSALRWVPFYRMGVRVAEILMSSYMVKVPSTTTNRESDVEVSLAVGLPHEIIPKMCFYRMQVHFVGLRQLCAKKAQGMVHSRVTITVGDKHLSSGLSDLVRGASANFPEETLACSLRLPENAYYWPSIVITHLDCSDVNRIKTVGVAFIDASETLLEKPAIEHTKVKPVHSTIIDLSDDDNSSLRSESVPSKVIPKLTIEASSRKPSIGIDELTWWADFYGSLLANEDRSHPLRIYKEELEKIHEFNGFKDWSGSYALYDAKCFRKKKSVYGLLKSKIEFTPIDEPLSNVPVPLTNVPPKIPDAVEVTVVVYVVQALNLASRDISSESDAYIVLTYGSECVRDRAYYISNQASPVFGRRFEMRGILPRDQMLHLSIYDRDFASPDDLIGSTCIDIENRFQSKHLPVFGLPQRFSSTGHNRWRHPAKPSQMLTTLCRQYGLNHPIVAGSQITVGGVQFDGTHIAPGESLTEQLCLLVLNRFEQLPNGFPLTPAHVETRSLYHPKRAGVEQGKVQLWVEIYRPDRAHPEPLDITPLPPKPYELRVIVWNTAEVVLNERNIFGTQMSDIYVKCWLQEFSKAQHTDVHYRSLTGEGNFNWRMVFPFRYSSADGMLVVRHKKAFYEEYDTELKFPPVLTVQIWDNDSFSGDDFLGTLDLNLNRLPAPARTAERCKSHEGLSVTGAGHRTLLNLFQRRRVRGWFPLHGNRDASYGGKTRGPRKRNTLTLTGKIELELEILSEADATQTPVGKGRGSPQHLPEPLRPEVSFNWLQQPTRTFHRLLWPRIRRSFAWAGAVVLLCLLLYGLMVNLPTIFMVRAFGQPKSSIVLSASKSTSTDR